MNIGYSPSRSHPGAAFVGFFERLKDGVATGWIVSGAAPDSPVPVYAMVDGRETGTVLADLSREDVRLAIGHPTGNVGFSYSVPDEYLDGQEHRLSFRLPGGMVLGYFDPVDPPQVRPDLAFRIKRAPKIIGFVDGMRRGQLLGWVTRTEPGTTEALGGCHVLVTCDGARVAQLRADRYRGDAATQTKGDPNCGFQMAVPRAFRSATPRNFRFEVMPEGIEIEGSPLVTSTVEDDLEAALLDVSNQMDAMFRDFVKLRRRVTEMVPHPGYTLSDYDRWARAYYPALRARVDAERTTRSKAGASLPNPLVSILVPTYRPLMSDFAAAIESVMAQTYAEWELVIVDDCSRSPELTAGIKAFCDRDCRIRTVVREQNGNISEATNTAIEAAEGEWIAFFDHDDLLVDVAIEMMVREAQRTGARVLYSDEDKIDQAGYFLEPNFKPDWNYRYMLGCNYVCHLLFVGRDTLAEVGPLQRRYDGAQDHDLVLRLSEIVPAAAIHHVAEVLYHWRKTPGSTASDMSQKGYAVAAGVLAVSDHLARQGAPAKVRSVRGLTLYNFVWKYTASPTVYIIIPFKDEVETTRKCLETVLHNTQYSQFEVVLVDNWSMTAEASAFMVEAQWHKKVRVLHVDEPFNFSRLNNLAAAQTNSEFLLFLNNDVCPIAKNWLRLLVNECLFAPGVAAAGGRLLYPDGTVQHAGVVVGPRGLAAHGHRGSLPDEFGFIGRVALSHEVTAVTAACMLVRAAVFHAVGGFDEVGFKVAYNDVDLCLRIRAAGHKIVYCSEMVATHHESLSRGSDDRPEDEARFFQEQQLLLDRWGDHPLFRHDPAYSPHLTVDRQTFHDLVPPVSAGKQTSAPG